jgi:hypothetical protein
MGSPPYIRARKSVTKSLGPKHELDVIDVATQSEVLPKWNLQEWVEYYNTPPRMPLPFHPLRESALGHALYIFLIV